MEFTHKHKHHKHKDHKKHSHGKKDWKHHGDGHKHGHSDGKCINTNACGESNDVLSAWLAAEEQAWMDGKDKEDVMRACYDGARDAGADLKTSTCIAAYCGAGTGTETCDIVDNATCWATDDGADADDAEKWADKGLSEIYDWYNEDTC